METSHCDYCEGSGIVNCYCGGDICLCGDEETECPQCNGGVWPDGGEEAAEGKPEYLIALAKCVTALKYLLRHDEFASEDDYPYTAISIAEDAIKMAEGKT